MTWVKRNLFFLIISVIAVVLTAGAVFYLLQNYNLREQNKEKLTSEYAELERMTTMNPGPGDGKKVDNISAATDYAQDIKGFIDRSGKFFRPIPRIPEATENTNVITDREFASALRDTLGLLTRRAQIGTVLLPPGYDFSFLAIKSKITFAPESLQPLAVQLGEVKAICDVLFDAKINALDSIRRERVQSADPMEVADYMDASSVTNDLAVLTPYEVTIRCFSSELSKVLSGFADSPYAIIVKRVSVTSDSKPVAAQPIMSGSDEGAAPPVSAGTREAVQARGVLPTVINELPIRVTMRLEIVKRLEATQ